jgi:hypothetical protein
MGRCSQDVATSMLHADKKLQFAKIDNTESGRDGADISISSALL